MNTRTKQYYSDYLEDITKKDLFNHKFKLSSLVTIANSTEKGYFVIRSCHKDASFECDDDLLRLFLEFQNKKTGLEVYEKFSNMVSEKEFIELLANWLKDLFILPIGKFDYYLIKEAITRVEENNDKVVITVVPTLYCNFKCIYCFEEHTNEKMSLEVINRLEVFFRDIFQKLPKQIRKISLYYYGGEPLLAKNEILLISEVFSKLTDEHQLSYTEISMVSNGFLIDDEFPEFVKKIGLKDIQITLDGTQEEHDKRRVRSGNKPTFNKIVQGIITASKVENLVIAIRVNIDSRNYESALNLPKFLAKRIKESGGNIKNIVFTFAPVQIHNEVCNIEVDNTRFILDHNIQNTFNNLDKEARIAGFPSPSEIRSRIIQSENLVQDEKIKTQNISFHNSGKSNRSKDFGLRQQEFQSFYHDSEEKKLYSQGDENLYSLKTMPIFCGVHFPYTFVVLPDGTLTKCWENLNIPEFNFGNLFDGIDRETHEPWLKRRTLAIPECWGCKDILICGGGCASKAFYNHKDIISPGCYYKSTGRLELILGHLNIMK